MKIKRRKKNLILTIAFHLFPCIKLKGKYHNFFSCREKDFIQNPPLFSYSLEDTCMLIRQHPSFSSTQHQTTRKDCTHLINNFFAKNNTFSLSLGTTCFSFFSNEFFLRKRCILFFSENSNNENSSSN